MIALFKTIDLVLQFYIFVLVGSAIFSWLFAFNIINQNSPVVRAIGQFFYAITEPVLRPIRRILPDLGPIDISPLVVFFIIYFIQKLMWTTLLPMFA